MAQSHTVKAYDAELNELRSIISQMGGLAEAQLAAAIESLIKRDSESALRIVAADKAIDALDEDAERLAVQIIALRAPMADDLREIISALKISSLLERIGDYAKNIAKRSTVLSQMESVEPLAIVPQMARIAAGMVKDVLDAFVARDIEKAIRVRDRDRAVDDLYNSLFRELLTYMMENSRHITTSAHLLFIAKNIERIGDHATNIAEIVYFSATGESIEVARPKQDDTAYAIVNPPAKSDDGDNQTDQ